MLEWEILCFLTKANNADYVSVFIVICIDYIFSTRYREPGMIHTNHAGFFVAKALQAKFVLAQNFICRAQEQ